ncbi:MAG TPA: septal ring lytic transglycosylase RlpA family protein [Xanthobacteraceae bacterium]
MGQAFLRATFAAIAVLAVAGCGSSDKFARRVDPIYGVPSSPRVVDLGDPVPKGGGVYRIGKPYVVAGRTYTPEHDPSYRAEGFASWYGDDFHGRRTANGEVFDQHAISAAHPTLPLPSYVRVTNLANRRSIIVRVNDRGPYAKDRVIDVSSKTSELLGFRPFGVARVRVEYVGPAATTGSDDRVLMATLRHDGQPAPAPSSVMVASTRPFVPQAAAPLVGARVAAVPAPPQRPYEFGTSSFSVASRDARPVPVTRVSAAPVPARATIAAASIPEPTAPAATPRPQLRAPDPTSSIVFSSRGLY